MDNIVVFLAKDLFAAVILVWAAAYFIITRPKRREFVSTLIIAGFIAVILSKILSGLYFHPRPFADGHITPLIPHDPSDNGFPSDHTVLVMTITASLYFYHKRLAALALVLGLLVGAGRVWAHVHSPLDIAAGIIVGFAAGYLGYQLSKRLWHKPKAKPVEKQEKS